MERIFTKEKKIKSLLSKHQFFDSLIQKRKKNISIDDLEINDLKKKKLMIKDEIIKLASSYFLFLYLSIIASISSLLHNPSSKGF